MQYKKSQLKKLFETYRGKIQPESSWIILAKRFLGTHQSKNETKKTVLFENLFFRAIMSHCRLNTTRRNYWTDWW